MKSVEVIAPKSLREKIKETLNVGISEYFNWGLGVRVCEKQGDCQPLPDGSFGWSGAYGTHFWVEPNTGRSAVQAVHFLTSLKNWLCSYRETFALKVLGRNYSIKGNFYLRERMLIAVMM